MTRGVSFLEGLKAVLKIVFGSAAGVFLGSLFSFFAVLLVRGTAGRVLGILIMLGFVALGAFIGGKAAKENVAEAKDAGKVAIWGSVIFLAGDFFLFAVKNIVVSMVQIARTDSWADIAQIAARALVIYLASKWTIRGMRKRPKILQRPGKSL